MDQRCCPHCGERIADPEILSFGGWTLDETTHELMAEGRRVHLTPIHCAIVGALMRASGRGVNREGLYNVVYGSRPECDQPDPKIIDVCVAKIRRLCRDQGLGEVIETVWGFGLKLKTRPYPDMSRLSAF